MQLSHSADGIPTASRSGGDRGTVIATRDQSVRAGLEMYEAGGNAVDASVCAALVAGVVEPVETSLAGSGFLLLHHPDHGPHSIEFGPLAPLAAHADMFEMEHNNDSSNVLGLAPVVGNANVIGPLASGVPRTLLGLLTAHQRWGKLPRKAILAPAIQAARAGFPADAWFIVHALQLIDPLRENPVTRETFLDERGLPLGCDSAAAYGRSVDSARPVQQSRLASTLETVADQPLSTLTEGDVATSLLQSSEELGMLLSREDLARSAPGMVRPLHLSFHRHDVWTPSAPGGGITELQALSIWQRLYPEGASAVPREEKLTRLDEVLRLAFADRYHWLGDPHKVPVPAEALLSEGYTRHAAQRLGSQESMPVLAPPGVPPWIHFAGHPVTDPWTFDPMGRKAPQWRPKTASTPSSGTTHVSAIDPEGWMVSITHTSAHHFGSGLMCPRTGLLFDSAMAWFNASPGAANSISSGARPVANMGPALVTRGGQSTAALGASGGRRIISAVTQLIISLVEDGMDPAEALALPRIDSSGPTTVVHQMDAKHCAAAHRTVVPQSANAHELDFARANIAAADAEGRCSSAIDGRSYDY
ncbi:gamma-glutamyltransferase family protein [Nesterenkonia muleiensis]|uniref:gamma-glutamyltransferase family protein n=1 Tax=Nesterenkonia muleiensis TaxID=2282648 RepID=UPI000E72C779|nr:gamma-glutamyltransferase [Nesterenkonia muleiensis]